MRSKYFHILYTVQLVLFVLIVLGIIPRGFAFSITGAIMAFILWRPIPEGTLFFIQSIPLFLALPFTESFDNFNAWRLISITLFVGWFLRENETRWWFKKTPITIMLFSLLGLALLSLVGASDLGAGMKRIVYFGNLSLIGIILTDLVSRNRIEMRSLMSAIATPTIIVIAVGFLQVISTYLIDIYQFMRLWGEGIQCNQYGQEWCNIAVRLGNTWFAYYGDQLSLRVFSLFPDSHSFPQFVLLGLPALLTLGIWNLTQKPEKLEHFKALIRSRGSLIIVWVPIGLLMAILSGTRGIWAASIGVIIVLLVTFLCMRRSLSAPQRNVFFYASSILPMFFLLFAIAYPIFTSPQFLLSKGDFGLFRNRIKSIIDFGETSNSQRIEIWKKSLESIKEKPLLGVGIGNFPVVLEQDVFLARAGSSAHNIYLHIAAEMGIPALIVSILFLAWVFWITCKLYLQETNVSLLPYIALALLCVPWVLIYSLTDVALFDERAFLLFVTTLAVIIGRYNHHHV